MINRFRKIDRLRGSTISYRIRLYLDEFLKFLKFLESTKYIIDKEEHFCMNILYDYTLYDLWINFSNLSISSRNTEVD